MSLFSPFIVPILTICLTYSEAAHCSQQNKSATGISSDDAFVRLYFLFPESYSSYSLQSPDRAPNQQSVINNQQSVISFLSAVPSLYAACQHFQVVRNGQQKTLCPFRISSMILVSYSQRFP